MPTSERVTVTLASETVREIDRLESNRSRFLQIAAQHELERRRRELLEQSLQHPHTDTSEILAAGFDEWATSLPAENVAEVIDPDAGYEVRWVEGQGWTRLTR